MKNYSTAPFNQISLLNKFLVESEIDFSRTVLFSAEIDLTEIEAIRSAGGAQRPSYTGFIAKAIAQAFTEFPYANQRIYHPMGLPFITRRQRFNHVDVAVAIERDVPGHDAVAYIEILRDVKNMPLSEVTKKLGEFSKADLDSSAQWRTFHNLGMKYPRFASWIASLSTRLPSVWHLHRGGAALISSPAKYGVDGVVGAWTHPVSFSFGLAQKKAMVKDDQVVAVKAFSFVMNFDRRLMAGAQAARCFARICNLLRQPGELLVTEESGVQR